MKVISSCMQFSSLVAVLSLLPGINLTADFYLVHDSWVTGVRDVQKPPTRSAWFASSGERLTASVGSMTGAMDGSSRIWLTHFTRESAYTLAVGETLQVEWDFTPVNINSGNDNRGFRFGLFDYSDGSRVVGDGISSSGANGAGVTGYLINMNFSPTVGVDNPLEIRRRMGDMPAHSANDNLMGSVPASGLFSNILGNGGGSFGDPYLQSGERYRLLFTVERLEDRNRIEVRISDNNGWQIAISGEDTTAPVHSFDTVAIRPDNPTRTAQSIIMHWFAVRVINDGLLPGHDIVFESDAISALSALSTEIGGGWFENPELGMLWTVPTAEPFIYSDFFNTFFHTQVNTGAGVYLNGGPANHWWKSSSTFHGHLWNFHEGSWFAIGEGGELGELVETIRINYDLTIPEGRRTLFLATDGDDGNDGSIDAPFGTLDHVVGIAEPGDVIYVRGGVYHKSETIRIRRSGTSQEKIYLSAYEDEDVVFDFSAQAFGSANRGIEVLANYWHFRRITVRNAGDNGFYITGRLHVFDQCVAHDNQDSGFQLDGGASYILVINCDSYRNFDAPNAGENADGFAVKFNIGPGNHFIGCRAWENSDDGWDLWRAAGSVIIENCWAFRNGVNIWDADPFTGNGNGFKLGGDGVAGEHVAIRNLAFENPRRGFDLNNNTGAQTLIHNTAVNNNQNYWFPMNPNIGRHYFANNLSHRGAANTPAQAEAIGNSWPSFLVLDSYFVTIDSTGADGPRQSDGSLPDLDFMKLVEGAFVINAGVDIGLPFNGTAPDMGAYEFGEPLE